MDDDDSYLHYSDIMANLPEAMDRAEILQVAIYEHGPRWSWKRTEVDHFNLWLALEGEGQFQHGGAARPFSSGSLFLFPAGMRTEGHATAGLRMVNFTVHLRLDAKGTAILENVADKGAPVRLRNFVWASHLSRMLTEAFYFRPAESLELIRSGVRLFLQAMEFERRLPETDLTGARLVQIVERIRRNPAAAYTVGELAALAELSEAQFTRRFRAMTGFTPNRFVVEERLARAELYLRETEMQVQEISNRLGYRDVYFFSRQFRRFRGMSPSAVRRRENGRTQ